MELSHLDTSVGVSGGLVGEDQGSLVVGEGGGETTKTVAKQPKVYGIISWRCFSWEACEGGGGGVKQLKITSKLPKIIRYGFSITYGIVSLECLSLYGDLG